MKKLYAMYGAGGFAREVMSPTVEMLSMTEDRDSFEVVFVIEDESAGGHVMGHRLMSDSAFLAEPADGKFFNIAIADAKVRERIANRLIESGVVPFTVRAPNVLCYERENIAEGAILCPFTMVTANARIGRFFHANIYSYVAHDCVIGDFVTFAPNVHCNGGVIIEDFAYIGAGAVLRQGTTSRPLVIGRGATVGMGAVVTKSVEPFTTVVGNPATVLRKT
jgi:sugar O-acyltransferase (sialic acid O-acetyltransferase NeuD family)